MISNFVQSLTKSMGMLAGDVQGTISFATTSAHAQSSHNFTYQTKLFEISLDIMETPKQYSIIFI